MRRLRPRGRARAAAGPEVRRRDDGGGHRRRRARREGPAGHRPDARGLRAARRRRARRAGRRHASGRARRRRHLVAPRATGAARRASRRASVRGTQTSRPRPFWRSSSIVSRPKRARWRTRARWRRSRPARPTTSWACSSPTCRWCRSRPTPQTGQSFARRSTRWRRRATSVFDRDAIKSPDEWSSSRRGLSSECPRGRERGINWAAGGRRPGRGTQRSERRRGLRPAAGQAIIVATMALERLSRDQRASPRSTRCAPSSKAYQCCQAARASCFLPKALHCPKP